MHYRNGKLGVGGDWRPTPSNTSAASRAGRSFHQDQTHADGFRGATAIDYVWEDGPDAGSWHDGVPTGGVPPTGTPEAAMFGIHANISAPGQKGWESWHGQPLEIDGWATATANGTRPAPAIDPNYPLPPEHDPYPNNPTIPEGPEMYNWLKTPRRVYDSRQETMLSPGETRRVSHGQFANCCIANVTVFRTGGEEGWVTVTGDPGTSGEGGTAVTNFDQDGEATGVFAGATPDGALYITAHGGPAHIAVELSMYGSGTVID